VKNETQSEHKVGGMPLGLHWHGWQGLVQIGCSSAGWSAWMSTTLGCTFPYGQFSSLLPDTTESNTLRLCIRRNGETYAAWFPDDRTMGRSTAEAAGRRLLLWRRSLRLAPQQTRTTLLGTCLPPSRRCLIQRWCSPVSWPAWSGPYHLLQLGECRSRRGGKSPARGVHRRDPDLQPSRTGHTSGKRGFYPPPLVPKLFEPGLKEALVPVRAAGARPAPSPGS
jgi:hypothetical protein